jgi:hypothetical protein
MSTRSETRTIYYVVGIAVIVIAFLLLGGGPWISGLGHGNGSMRMTNLHWGQIVISLGLSERVRFLISSGLVLRTQGTRFSVREGIEARGIATKVHK